PVSSTHGLPAADVAAGIVGIVCALPPSLLAASGRRDFDGGFVGKGSLPATKAITTTSSLLSLYPAGSPGCASPFTDHVNSPGLPPHLAPVARVTSRNEYPVSESCQPPSWK